MKKLILLTFIFLSTLNSFSQVTGTIRGVINDKTNKTPILFANVMIEGTTLGTSSNENGLFALSQIPKGTHTLIVSTFGYQTFKKTIIIEKNDQIISLKIELIESQTELNTVYIDADEEIKKNTINISMHQVSQRDIKMIPTTGGDADLATYLQVIPGVMFSGEQGGQLYIRGGTPIQNLVLIDGMTLYNPFHSIGLYSVFDTDIIQNVDVYTGGFGAQYGGRISSVIDITTRDGNKQKLAGKVSASTFMAKVNLEGPIKKPTEEKPVSISYLLSAKNSYLNQTSQSLYSYIDKDNEVKEGLPYSFEDYYGKVSINGDNGSKVNFFGFSFNDLVNYQSISSFNWKNVGAGANFVLIPTSSPSIIEGHFAYSQYKIASSENNFGERESGINSFDFGFDFTSFKNKNQLKYGFGANGTKTNLLFTNAVGRTINENVYNTDFYGYLSSLINIKRVVILEPGIRMQYYVSLGKVSVEPRLGLKYNISEKLRFKASTGIYSQNLIASNSDRDIVNLFYGFISSPENYPETYTDKNGNTTETENALQTAIHYIGGFEYDFSNKLTANIEGYYKDYNQLFNINRNKLYEDTPENSNVNDLLKKDFIKETGASYGLDVSLKYNNRSWYIYGNYSLGFSTRYDGVREYNPVYDRRHNVNIVVNHSLKKYPTWDFSLRWNFGSGLPFTPTKAYYGQSDFNDGINSDVITDNPTLTTYYGDLNSKRLPNIHRLDFSVTKTITFKRNTKMEIIGSITNVYNEDNIFYIQRITNDVIYQLPIIPSIGVNWQF